MFIKRLPMSKYYTKVVIQMTDELGVYLPVSRTSVEYDGVWEFCGGGSPDPTAVAEEKSQAAFDTTLQQIFSEQYASQSAQLKYLQGQLEPIINEGGQGYTPEQLAAQRTSATDVNSQQFQNAQDVLQNSETQASGGSKLTGVAGANTEAEAGLLNAEAQTQAASQENITQTNAQLQQQSYWNSINALNGVAAQENPLGYAGSASSAAGAAASDSQANSAHIKATSSPIWGAIGGALSGAGTAAGGIIWCLVAIALYGRDSLKTHVVRSWMVSSAPKWFSSWYLKNSPWIAKTRLRYAFLPLFESVLAYTRMA